MPGGVTGKAREGVPMSILVQLRADSDIDNKEQQNKQGSVSFDSYYDSGYSMVCVGWQMVT